MNFIENYLNKLIKTVIDENNLSKMYYRWLPL